MNLKLFKTSSCPEVDKEVLRHFVNFMKYAVKELRLEDKSIKIRLLGANTNEPITTGAYSPADKTISVIIENRHPIDWFRTISHEMTHMAQDYNGELNTPHAEIGGPIEDNANIMSGRITKYFVKNILTPDDKKRLGLGTYGS
jgi:hypothetical protein